MHRGRESHARLDSGGRYRAWLSYANASTYIDRRVSAKQGDQIGRIGVLREIFHFDIFFQISVPSCFATFSTKTVVKLVTLTIYVRVGLHFGRLFKKSSGHNAAKPT
jgi:hypothetical protein